MAVAIAIVLVLAGVAVLWLGQHLWRSFTQSLAEVAQPPPDTPREALTRPHGLRADALVFLFAERFVRTPAPNKPVNPRLRAGAPLTDEDLDARDWACKLLFALLAEQHELGAVEFRTVSRTPTLMPPFPHKNWELEARRERRLADSPLGDCLAVAFDMLEKRTRPGEDEPGPDEPGGWYPLELVVEKMLTVVRAETGFWQREGVYGDLRNYVAETLAAEGYLTENTSNTWVEHFRRRRMEPNREAIATLAEEADALRHRLRSLRRRYGSAEFLGEEDREATYTHLNTPASLTSVEDVSQVLWADALGITIFETLVALRQLEPTGDGSA